MIEFKRFPKIARLNRDITITEKIDGTEGAIGIVAVHSEMGGYVTIDGDADIYSPKDLPGKMIYAKVPSPFSDKPIVDYLVYAQSRNRIITPEQDNHGFARWVYDNAEELAHILGPGVHHGEWWGSGIQRGYGLAKGEKRFSLFNTSKWNDEALGKREGFLYTPIGLGVVPVLYEGPYSQLVIGSCLLNLKHYGSVASYRYERPEGIVIYHHAANTMFKVTLEHDEKPKGSVEIG